MTYSRIHAIGVFAFLGVAAVGATPTKASTEPVATEPVVAADPMFAEPYVDVDEWRDAPVRHRFIHGGFKGTDTRFVFYFPPVEQYEGRFFQYITPVPIPEDQSLNGFGSDGPFKGTGVVGFAFASGAYAVGSNQGGKGATATPGGKVDPSIAAYRASAAVAQYSRVIANGMYGAKRPYGYAYGGSGGSMRTISGVENTKVWDGAVPYVIGTPQAIPSPFTVRAHAIRVLRSKLPAIAEAVQPGGNQSVFSTFTDDERSAWDEVSGMGFPIKAWRYWGSPFLGLGSFEFTFGQMRRNDSGYFKDFWTVPGYHGANPTSSLMADRVQQANRVARVVMSDQAAEAGLPAPFAMPGADAANAWRTLQQRRGGVAYPVAIELVDPPAPGDLRLADLKVQGGGASGSTFSIAGFSGKFAMLAVTGPSAAQADPSALKSGDAVLVDNSDFLAAQTYHRHQVPDRSYSVWDQFRKPDHTPLYPQRAKLMGEGFYQSAASTLPTGNFNGKMIIVQALQDFDAFPWMADWYGHKVNLALGKATDSRYRLWYVDNANHGAGYQPVLEQALRDLAAWVEKGTPPPASTSYRLVNGQVIVPENAAQRSGVQPLVTVAANGTQRVEIGRGQAVTFKGAIEVPKRAGSIIAAEWDFDGDGKADFITPVRPGAKRVSVVATHSFEQTGSYYATLRAVAQRQGDTVTAYARVENQASVRVVVKD